MRNIIAFIILFLVILCSCFHKRKPSGEGTLIKKIKGYDSLSSTYSQETFFPDMRIWYKDSMAIEEIRAVNTYTDLDKGTTTTETPIAYYVFIHVPTRSFYHYSSLSDTATLLMSYTQDDSLQMKGLGGWPFYSKHSNKKDWKVIAPLQQIKDTVIDNIKYKRIVVKSKYKQYEPVTRINYLLCDKKGTMFQLYQQLGEKLGCPIVRTDDVPDKNHRFAFSDRLEFVSDVLTSEEQRIFIAWQKYAKAHPVKQ